ncbi:MAG: DUF501 domain-containing protein [Microthrixaceae bacterium]
MRRRSSRTSRCFPTAAPCPPAGGWLTRSCAAAGTLEAEGGVRRAEEAVGAEAMAEAHRRYEALRNQAMPVDHQGPRPTGGVGGTRRGGKCLHAHLAWWLAGGADPTGEWVAARLAERDELPEMVGVDGPVRWPAGHAVDEDEAP